MTFYISVKNQQCGSGKHEACLILTFIIICVMQCSQDKYSSFAVHVYSCCKIVHVPGNYNPLLLVPSYCGDPSSPSSPHVPPPIPSIFKQGVLTIFEGLLAFSWPQKSVEN